MERGIMSHEEAHHGTPATDWSAPVLGRSSTGTLKSLVKILSPSSVGASCGRDGRTAKNRRGARRFPPNTERSKAEFIGADGSFFWPRLSLQVETHAAAACHRVISFSCRQGLGDQPSAPRNLNGTAISNFFQKISCYHNLWCYLAGRCPTNGAFDRGRRG